MGLLTFICLLIIQTSILIFVLFSDKSAATSAVIFGLSSEKIILIVLMIAVLVFLLIQLFNLARSTNRKNTRPGKFLGVERNNFALIFCSLAIIAVIYFILIRDRTWFPAIESIIKELKPIFTWMLLVAIQTLFFTIFNYYIHYTEKDKQIKISSINKEITLLIILFILLLLIKTIFVLPKGYGLLKDIGESKFYYATKYLNDGIFLYSASADELVTNFPFLYPLSLFFGYFVKDHSFEIIKLINAIQATSIVFPLYMLLDHLFSEKRKFIFPILLILSLIPFQYHLPIRLLSENLYFPLFLWTMALIFKDPQNDRYKLHWDILTGIFLGLLYLTRYITFAIMPAFVLFWWIKPFKGELNIFKLRKDKIFHATLIILIFILVYSPWIIISLNNDFSFREALGFGIAKETNPGQLTVSSLIKWIFLYSGYVILMASPVLHLILAYFQNLLKIEKAKRWLTLSLLLCLFFITAVVRHSWRANYNFELPLRIMGRYIIYLMPMIIITAFLVIASIEDQPTKISWLSFLRLTIIPIALIAASFLLLVKGSIYPIHEAFIHPLISIDVYYIILLKNFFILFIPIFFVFSLYILKTSPRKLLVITFTGLILYFSWAMPNYISFLEGYQYHQQIGATISDILIECNPEHPENLPVKILLPKSYSQASRLDIVWSLVIRNLKQDFEIETYLDEKLETNFTDPTIVVKLIDQPTSNDKDSEYLQLVNDQYIIQYFDKIIKCSSKFTKKYKMQWSQ